MFSRIRVDTADDLDPDDRLPLTVTVVERPCRVIGFGADYVTSGKTIRDVLTGDRFSIEKLPTRVQVAQQTTVRAAR